MKRIFAILLTLVLILGTWTTAIALPEGAVARLGKGSISWEDRAVQFSPDGTLLAVATSIGVYLYDVQTHNEVALLETNTSMNSVAFFPNGRILASGSYKEIKLWDHLLRRAVLCPFYQIGGASMPPLQFLTNQERSNSK